MSYLILVAMRDRWQFPVNIAALPLAVLILILCAIAVRKEWTLLMVLSIFGLLAGEVYFIYQASHSLLNEAYTMC
jgi:succinate-acetate transporter protein